VQSLRNKGYKCGLPRFVRVESGSLLESLPFFKIPGLSSFSALWCGRVGIVAARARSQEAWPVQEDNSRMSLKRNSMKLAAILALLVAIVSGAWGIIDYRNNEAGRRYFERQGITYLDFRTDAGKPVQLDVRKMSDYYERRDAEIGALSIASLIGSAALFSRRRRVTEPISN
jgi:hypothetical protein